MKNQYTALCCLENFKKDFERIGQNTPLSDQKGRYALYRYETCRIYGKYALSLDQDLRGLLDCQKTDLINEKSPCSS